MQPTHGCGTCFRASSSRPQQSLNAHAACIPSLCAYSDMTSGLDSRPTQFSCFGIGTTGRGEREEALQRHEEPDGVARDEEHELDAPRPQVLLADLGAV